MTAISFTRSEIVSYMMEEAAVLFHSFGEATITDNTLTATPFDDEPVTITARKFSAALTTWAKENKDSSYPFHRTAARDILASNWDHFDYDASISGAIIESLVFG